MLDGPDRKDISIVLAQSGSIVHSLGLIGVIPLLTAAFFSEWSAFFDFMLLSSVCFLIGTLLSSQKKAASRPTWVHGMVTAAFSWILVMVLGALPNWLSAHYSSYLDCMFDIMSGFTTTGLTLINDLDHVSVSLNMWRHVITFVGGQGIIVLALSFLVKDSTGGYKLYVGEGKDERLFPSVFHTARTIWKISLIYLAFGTLSLWITGCLAGLPWDQAFLHGLWIYMAAWSTGGFAPMSQNILFYHSGIFEIVTILFFVIGSLNFALHHALWSGNRKEIRKNIEAVVFSVSVIILFSLACAGLSRSGQYPDIVSLFRKVFYQVLSGHTTTGFMTIYARQFALEWGEIALFAMTCAMLIGGSACSTAGGIKCLRVGLILKAVVFETKRLLKPVNTVFPRKIHYHGTRELSDDTVRLAALIAILYMVTWGLTTLAGMACGYTALESSFEAASVTGNVGLSIGVTSPSMPDALKALYIIVMWAGRLEFMATLCFAAFIASLWKQR